MSAPDYFATHAPTVEEQLRLKGLEMLWDPVTRRRLIAAGIAPGQRCLEAGAGGGSVTRMMAELTHTRVVAVDMNPRFLDPTDARYEVRRLDLTDPSALEGKSFDVIHCRFLLMHLPDPVGVLRTLHERLAPGGFMLIEEPDMRTWSAADSSAPGAQMLDRVIAVSLEAVERAGVWRNAFGRRLKAILQQMGLADVTCEGVCWIAEDQHPEIVAVTTQSLQLAAVSAIASGVLSQEDLDAAVAVMRERKTAQVTPTMFSTVGRRPR